MFSSLLLHPSRSFLGHFAKMDRGNDGALTRQEMLAYFTIMHAAFDADYDNVVTRAEAPTLLLRIKLLGRGFPKEGLTLEELTDELEETLTTQRIIDVKSGVDAIKNAFDTKFTKLQEQKKTCI